MDKDGLFLSDLIIIPGMTKSEFESEWEKMRVRNREILKFIKGVENSSISKGDADSLYDLLAEDGIEPYDFLDTAVENANYVVEAGIFLDA